jgi:hypothetical protein
MNNAEIVVGRDYTTIRATMPIEHGAEICVRYGRDYWREDPIKNQRILMQYDAFDTWKINLRVKAQAANQADISRQNYIDSYNKKQRK